MSLQLWSPSVEAELAYRREQLMAASERNGRRPRRSALRRLGHAGDGIGFARHHPEMRRIGRTA